MGDKLAKAFEKYGNTFETRTPRIQAKLTDVINGGSGDASVAGRPGYVWANVGGVPLQIRAPDIMPVAELPVTLQASPIDGVYETVGVTYGAIDGWDGTPFNNQHGAQHNIEGGDPTYIDQRQLLIGLLRAQSTPDMTVLAGEVFYTYQNQTVYFPETDTADLTSEIPAIAGSSVWVMVGIDAATNALVYETGSSFALLDDPTDYFPAIPNDTLVLGDIRLESTTTTITQAMIDGSRRPFLNVPAQPEGALRVENTSGATAVAKDAGYINADGEYKTTTTASAPNINWCVVIVGGANNTDIFVARQGRVDVNVASGVVAGEFLETTTTAGRADGRTGASPSIFARALTNESSNVCSALLLTGRTYVPIASANDVIGINASLDSDTNGTTPWYGTINDAAPTVNPVTMATTTGSLVSITPNLTTNLSKMVMRNTTRGNEAFISSITGNDVTFVSIPSNWVNGDALNAESANIGNGYRLLDMSGQSEVPVTAVALNLIMVLTDSLGVGATMYIHPDETFSGVKQKFHTNAVTAQVFRLSRFQPLINMRFGLRNSSSTALATNVLYLGMDGYIEATP